MTKDSKVRTMVGLVGAALVVGTVAIGVAYAQQPAGKGGQKLLGARGMMARGGVMGGGPLMAVRRGLAQLGLSDEQKQQIKAIVQGHKDELKGNADRLRQSRRAVADAIASDSDEATIRAKSAELAAAQADLAVMGAKLRKQVFAVLTPDQQAKAKTLRGRALNRVNRLLERRKKLWEF